MYPSRHSSERRHGRQRITRLGLGSLLAALSVQSRAAAQTEAEKPAPNVLLLVDTSGSMEFVTEAAEFPHCEPLTPNLGSDDLGPNGKSRWIDLVEVLTGDFKNYSCTRQERNTPEFQSEFSLGGVSPYDFGYVNPYHRAMANGCYYGAGALPASPYAWSEPSVRGPSCSVVEQDGNGLLDAYRDIRFGLMTFDARVSDATGLNGTGAGATANYASGMEGNWSYFLGSPATGHPANCDPGLLTAPQEVGARNAAAPPWEGRMVAFGSPTLADNTVRNGWIQKILLSTRPYGATPINGQLDDARAFLWDDANIDPLDGTEQFGPRADPNWEVSNCRKTILILLTDGEPNLDLRPYCANDPGGGIPGVCPYPQTPEEIVADLRNGVGAPKPSQAVETYVVAFALGNVTTSLGPKSCALLTTECGDPSNAGNTQLQACCTLNKIAAAGGLDSAGDPRRAFFPEDRAQLRATLTSILNDVTQVATRTLPVFSSPGGDSQTEGLKFFAAFDPKPDPLGPALWEGVLERQRFVCSTTPPITGGFVPVDPGKGDDFGANLNSNPDDRHFYTVVTDGKNDRTIRPAIATDKDGLGISVGTLVSAIRPADLTSVVPANAMGASVDAATRDRILKYAIGLTNDADETRCPVAGCSLLGGIFHSTPTVVPGRPSELLRDDSYAEFIKKMFSDRRPSVLYTASVDGFLHAFDLAPFPGSDGADGREVDDLRNNELWSFIPPAVLPVLHAQYPNNPRVLLDGVPIIKEVVAFDSTSVTRFERLQSEAQGSTGTWRSVLVSGFGEGPMAKGGYFALDVTRPSRTLNHGPKFLWQLTTDATGAPLFGVGGTPLITTVFLKGAGVGDPPIEVPVAVLPGGNAPADSGNAASIGPVMAADPLSLESGRAIRNYIGKEVARSLTIVRLDTGEIVRTFRPPGGAGPFDPEVFTNTNIPAPITGQPKAFPELAGAVADRLFVGDREGRLWRVDVSSQDSSKWEMEIFYDAFADAEPTNSGIGQPVILPPVLSVNDAGDVTIAFATGDQDLTTPAPTTENRVVSLTETLNASNEFVAHVNWVQPLRNGDRVTGPMVLFNRGLYYAASRPPGASVGACNVGQSQVYGAHYEISQAVADAVENPSPLSGPAPAPGATELELLSEPGLTFGVSLQAQPSCSTAEDVIDGNDSFGYGTVTMSQTVAPTKYFLTFEVSGNAKDPRGVLEISQPLEDLHVPVTFDSWALIYE